MQPKLSIIMSAHNPHLGRLRSSLEGIAKQDLPLDTWEMLLVDNASTSFPSNDAIADVFPRNMRKLEEPELGLAFGRICGLTAARGDCAVLVDDDNVLDPSYLTNILNIFDAHPGVGIAGGKSLPLFEALPPPWLGEFFSLLALRDLGDEQQLSQGLRDAEATLDQYPYFAPIGAGMALRRPAWEAWLTARDVTSAITGRRGNSLASGEDCDIVFSAMRAGWEVGYFPQLTLQHLIPAGRLDPRYLERLNRGIQKSWMQLLTAHNANPWSSVSSSGAMLRKVKAWLNCNGWSGPVERIRWQGACGHFDGRIRKQLDRP